MRGCGMVERMYRFGRLAMVGVGLCVAAGVARAQQQATEPALPFRVVEPAFVDRSVDPCVDFYKFSCNGWLRTHPIPADRASYGRFTELSDYNNGVLRQILEKAAAGGPGQTPNEQKIGDLYGSCMDTAAIDAKGLRPIEPLLARVSGLKRRDEIGPLMTEFELDGLLKLMAGDSTQDAADSTKVIGEFYVQGLGLPDRDYYTRMDPKSVEQRKQYVAHVARVLELSGEPAAQAGADAATVLALETEIAKARLTLVERRDPHNTYHPMQFAAFAKTVPALRMEAFAKGLGLPQAELGKVNVTEPKAFAELDRMVREEDLAKLRVLLRWEVVHSFAGLSSPAAFDEAHFDFYNKTLRGQQQQQPRWKRCTRLVDEGLGEALGQVYVAQVFPPETRERARAMARQIEEAMSRDLDGLDWMSAATKEQAKVKLRAIANKVGYPDKWRDYSSVHVERGALWTDEERLATFEVHRDLNKIGKPVDKGEWGMTPPTVNAYYNPQMNDVNFPAGYLQPPFFSAKEGDAENYGDMGSTMGHELTHGFDDEGRQFDAQGNLRDWWTKEDEAKFQERADCVVKQFDGYTAVDDLHVNGRLTLGENIADIGGTLLAYMAWQDLEKGAGAATEKTVDGFTPAQRFWIANAQQWCTQTRPEDLRARVQTDPHAPDSFRINGVVEDLPEFGKDFGCKVGSPMRPAHACRVW